MHYIEQGETQRLLQILESIAESLASMVHLRHVELGDRGVAVWSKAECAYCHQEQEGE